MTSRSVDAHEESGFTLLETIVAFAVLSLVIATATEIIGGSAVREQRAEAEMRALVHAQSLLAVVSNQLPEPAQARRGAFEGGYEWTLTISPVRDQQHGGDDGTVPYVAAIEVSTPSNDASVVLRTVLLNGSEAAPP